MIIIHARTPTPPRAGAPARFSRTAHTPGRIEVRAEERNPNFSFTLDLRR
jgi:hypothetical protein